MLNGELEFDEDLLVPGTHFVSRDAFLKTFCNESERKIGRYREAARSDFYKPFCDIVEWAQDVGATSIVVGGSFISRKECPSDMDIVILFAKADQRGEASMFPDVSSWRCHLPRC